MEADDFDVRCGGVRRIDGQGKMEREMLLLLSVCHLNIRGIEGLFISNDSTVARMGQVPYVPRRSRRV